MACPVLAPCLGGAVWQWLGRLSSSARWALAAVSSTARREARTEAGTRRSSDSWMTASVSVSTRSMGAVRWAETKEVCRVLVAKGIVNIINQRAYLFDIVLVNLGMLIPVRVKWVCKMGTLQVPQYITRVLYCDTPRRHLAYHLYPISLSKFFSKRFLRPSSTAFFIFKRARSSGYFASKALTLKRARSTAVSVSPVPSLRIRFTGPVAFLGCTRGRSSTATHGQASGMQWSLHRTGSVGDEKRWSSIRG